MEAIVYTRDDKEYNLIKTILENEAELIDIDRHPLNGHKRYDHGYDVAVVALKGAEGMERLEKSIRDVIEHCPNKNRWTFPAKRREKMRDGSL